MYRSQELLSWISDDRQETLRNCVYYRRLATAESKILLVRDRISEQLRKFYVQKDDLLFDATATLVPCPLMKHLVMSSLITRYTERYLWLLASLKIRSYWNYFIWELLAAASLWEHNFHFRIICPAGKPVHHYTIFNLSLDSYNLIRVHNMRDIWRYIRPNYDSNIRFNHRSNGNFKSSHVFIKVLDQKHGNWGKMLMELALKLYNMQTCVWIADHVGSLSGISNEWRRTWKIEYLELSSATNHVPY